MNNFKSYALATVGIVSLVVSLALNVVRANNGDASTVTASTAHFNQGNTYGLTPANGSGQIRCKVTQVDGAWLKCEGEKLEWVNTNTMMYASDSKWSLSKYAENLSRAHDWVRAISHAQRHNNSFNRSGISLDFIVNLDAWLDSSRPVNSSVML